MISPHFEKQIPAPLNLLDYHGFIIALAYRGVKGVLGGSVRAGCALVIWLVFICAIISGV